ncbi:MULTISPECIES: hypothetical protein [unclassified Bradyrhizobium]|uniref:hypothetical protein n=1 Tax=unclassified Bradyrhizobium TaxID=2631580 RepID=UPI0028E802C2|nr:MULTISPECIES: hypothetical protein [unclassified Bradyrhizobium]
MSDQAQKGANTESSSGSASWRSGADVAPPAKHLLDYLMTFFAFVAAIGGVAAAAFTGWQAWIASDNEERYLRAYIHVTHGRSFFLEKPDGSWDVSETPAYKVYGQTPAGSVAVKWRMRTETFPMNAKTFYLDHMATLPSQTTTVDAPNEERYADTLTMTLLKDDISKIQGGTHRFYVYGTILYVDVFQRSRYTNFCYYFDIEGLRKGYATNCPLHNNADWFGPNDKSTAVNAVM